MPSNVVEESSWPNTGRGRSAPAAVPSPKPRTSPAPAPAPVSRATPGTVATPVARANPVLPANGSGLGSASRGPDGELMLLTEMGQVLHVATPPVTEAIRYMLARLRLDGADLSDRLGITSAIRGEGVTFVTRSLALVLTSDAARNVCIVDLNWASPSAWVSGTPELGVAEIIRDELPYKDALITTGNAGLTILPAGTATMAERPALANSPELERMLSELGETFDHVLLDLPAVHATSEALTLAEYSGALAVVVNQGVTPESQVKSALEQLAGVSMLGIILNRATSKIPRIVRRRMTAV